MLKVCPITAHEHHRRGSPPQDPSVSVKVEKFPQIVNIVFMWLAAASLI